MFHPVFQGSNSLFFKKVENNLFLFWSGHMNNIYRLFRADIKDIIKQIRNIKI